MKVQNLPIIKYNNANRLENGCLNTPISLRSTGIINDIVQINSKAQVSFGKSIFEKMKLKQEAKAIKKESDEILKTSSQTISRIADYQKKAGLSVRYSRDILDEAKSVKNDIKQMFVEFQSANPIEGVLSNVGSVERYLIQDKNQVIIREFQRDKQGNKIRQVRETIVDDKHITTTTTIPYAKTTCYVFDRKTFELMNFSRGFEYLQSGGFRVDDRFVYQDEKLKCHQMNYRCEYDPRAREVRESAEDSFSFKNDKLSEYAHKSKEWESGRKHYGEKISIKDRIILHTINEKNKSDGSYRADESYLLQKFSQLSRTPKLSRYEKNISTSANGKETFEEVYSYQNGSLRTVAQGVCQTKMQVESEKEFEFAGVKTKPVGCKVTMHLPSDFVATVKRYVKF